MCIIELLKAFLSLIVRYYNKNFKYMVCIEETFLVSKTTSNAATENLTLKSQCVVVIIFFLHYSIELESGFANVQYSMAGTFFRKLTHFLTHFLQSIISQEQFVFSQRHHREPIYNLRNKGSASWLLHLLFCTNDLSNSFEFSYVTRWADYYYLPLSTKSDN